MKRILLVVLITGLLAMVAVPVALAARPAVEDAWIDSSATSYNTAFLHVRSSVSGSNCSVTTTSYLKFDLTDVATAVGTVNLTLEYTYVNLGGGNTTLTMLPVTDDSWTETTVGTIKPAPGATVLSTLQFPPAPAAGDKVTFPSTPELVNFFNQEATGDNFASIALRITGCTAGAPEVRFASAENAGNEPSLDLLGPNSVSLSQTSAERVTWPLYAGLSAVALFIVAGVAISRRRTA